VIADNFHGQSLRIRQSEDLFGKSVKFGFTQSPCLRCDALNGSAASDEPVRLLAPISPFIVGGAVSKALDFVHEFNRLNDIKMDRKRPPTFSVDDLGDDMGFQTLWRK